MPINISFWVYCCTIHSTQTHLNQMNWEVHCKANPVVWSHHFILGLLILGSSQKACLPRAFSAAKKKLVNFVSVEKANRCIRSWDLTMTTESHLNWPDENWEANVINILFKIMRGNYWLYGMPIAQVALNILKAEDFILLHKLKNNTSPC